MFLSECCLSFGVIWKHRVLLALPSGGGVCYLEKVFCLIVVEGASRGLSITALLLTKQVTTALPVIGKAFVTQRTCKINLCVFWQFREGSFPPRIYFCFISAMLIHSWDPAISSFASPHEVLLSMYYMPHSIFPRELVPSPA